MNTHNGKRANVKANGNIGSRRIHLEVLKENRSREARMNEELIRTDLNPDNCVVCVEDDCVHWDDVAEICGHPDSKDVKQEP